MSGREVKIVEADMSQAMQDELVAIVVEAIDMPQDVLDIALYIRIQFEGRHGQHWNCIVGCNCNGGTVICSVATHPGGWVKFTIGDRLFVLFQSPQASTDEDDAIN